MSNASQLGSWFKWGAALALLGMPIGCAPLDAAEGMEQPDVALRTGALVTNIRIAGHVGAGRVGIGGVSVALNGGQQKTTVTDANGNFKFDVTSGSYSVNFSKPSATINPNVLNLNGLTASTFQTVSCVSGAGCAAPTTIVPAAELVITDPGVVGDARTKNTTTGAWSFRNLMKQMAPGQNESSFTLGWLDQLRTGGTVNGFPVDPRSTALLNFTVNSGGTLNWSDADLKLVAIVNRTDLHSTGAGELRFIYGQGGAMTVIFEFGLPATRDRKGWAQQFHQLSTLTPGSAAYNTALQAITDQVVKANVVPSKPNGSAINQVRVNEILLATATSPNWQLREFHLQAGGILLLSPTAGTPDDSVDVAGGLNTQLANFINANIVDLQAGFATVPAALLGGQPGEDFAKQSTQWLTFSPAVNEAGRHAFAGATCNGCHFSEVNRSSAGTQNLGIFYQISPSGGLSPLMTSVEIPRRAIFAQHILTCSGASCGPGAEPLLP